ncbi:unnamed protein product [Cuscuta epithymum]|uniref:Uncharacterized protein n=1 Tax=Cuscuta epithymum TaxID=186058 RepID=A0AAV0FKU4_9ASTE|nr:unnamed protein product [Cuscuta epithymum]
MASQPSPFPLSSLDRGNKQAGWRATRRKSGRRSEKNRRRRRRPFPVHLTLSPSPVATYFHRHTTAPRRNPTIGKHPLFTTNLPASVVQNERKESVAASMEKKIQLLSSSTCLDSEKKGSLRKEDRR